MKALPIFSGMALLGILITGLSSCEKTETEVTEPTSTIPSEQDHPHAERYRHMIDDFTAAGEPGFGLSVITPEGVWTGTGGMADLGNGIRLEPGHTFRIGSASKVFTATLVMMLYEEGLIDLDQKISAYIPAEITDRIPNGNVVTVRQLLNHSSGIPEHLSPKSYLEIINLSQYKLSAEEALTYIYDKKPLAPAGEEISYSNSNYLLLALVIRNVTGAATAYQVMKERIFLPLGLSNTFPGTEIPPSMSLGYYEYYGHMKELTYADNAAVGGVDRLDGGIISNSYDLARFMKSLMSGELVSEETLGMMLTFNPVEIYGFEHITGYGLGLMRIETESGTGYGHYGSVHCFHSALFYFPEPGTTVAYTLNGGSHELQGKAYSAEAMTMAFQDE